MGGSLFEKKAVKFRPKGAKKFYEFYQHCINAILWDKMTVLIAHLILYIYKLIITNLFCTIYAIITLYRVQKCFKVYIFETFLGAYLKERLNNFPTLSQKLICGGPYSSCRIIN